MQSIDRFEYRKLTKEERLMLDEDDTKEELTGDETQPLKEHEKPNNSTSNGIDPIAQDISEYAALLSTIIDNPDVIADKIKQYITGKYPLRISTAYWVTMKTHDRDKGLDFEILRLPFEVQLSALLGQHSFGFGVEKEILHTGNAKWNIGVAAVANYHDLKHWEPAGFISVRF